MKNNRRTIRKASVYSLVIGAALPVSPVMASDYAGEFCFRVEYVTGTLEADDDPISGFPLANEVVYLPENEYLYQFSAHDKKLGIYDLEGYAVNSRYPDRLIGISFKVNALKGAYQWTHDDADGQFDRNSGDRLERVYNALPYSKWTTDLSLNGEAVTDRMEGVIYDTHTSQLISWAEREELTDELVELAMGEIVDWDAIEERFQRVQSMQGTVETIPCSEFPDY